MMLKRVQSKTDRNLRMTEAFETLVAATEAYLGSLLKVVEDGMRTSCMPESVVILADPQLMELPLEALGVFHLEGIKSVSRDFSLQIFHNRYVQETAMDQGHAAGIINISISVK